MTTTTKRPTVPTMRAVVHDAYGTPDLLEVRDVPVPTVAAGEVLIRVRAASANAGDWFVLTGSPYLLRLVFGLRRPRVAIRGRDVAGVVEAVGTEVTTFAPGDEVLAESDHGSFAEFTTVPAKVVARKPAALTFEHAATLPVAAITALQGLRDVGRLQAGQHVLINGASGGVGTFAVQIAKATGAEVTAVCSPSKVDLVRSLGADNVIDYTREDLAAGDRRYDVVLDLVGNRTLRDLRRVLTRRGRLVLSSGAGGRWLGPLPRYLRGMLLSLVVRQTLRPLAATRSSADLDALADLVVSGAVTPAVDRTVGLSDAAEALRYVGTGHARAKIVVTV